MSCTNSTNIFLLGLASSMKTDIRTINVNSRGLMTFAYSFSVTIMFILCIISNLISIDTFVVFVIRSTTVGICLCVYSCCSLFGILMLECRLFQLIDSLNYISFFLICNLVSGLASVFTRICLWLNGLIALHRSLNSFEHNHFLTKLRSKSSAIKQIFILIVLIFLMHIHEFICRVVLSDPVQPGKFVCQINYSKQLFLLNEIFTFCHIFIPFSLHVLSTCLIIGSISHRRAILHQTSYRKQWIKQFHCHSHLLVSPIVAMVI
jgi:hypothetical protein